MNIKHILGLILSLTVAGYAGTSMAGQSNGDAPHQNQSKLTMPGYENSVTIPAYQGAFVVIRYYEPWGDGTRTGWEIPVETPTVTFAGNTMPLTDYFSADSTRSTGGTPYIEGQVEGGYDQHAQYYVAALPVLNNPAQLTIQGSFEMVGYYSATVYFLTGSNFPVSSQITLLDRKMPVTAGLNNPYVTGDPSIFAYNRASHGLTSKQAPAPVSFSKDLENLLKPNPLPLHINRAASSSGAISLYRMDAASSKTRVADDIAPDGCSQAYLVATVDPTQQIEILRMKVPKSFVQDNLNRALFGQYQTREFSVNANIKSMQSVFPILDFWTVSNRMLQDYEDSNGYAYVFFAPNAYVQQLAREQHTPARQPPVLTWGNYKGYVLGTPNENIVLRYRDPDSTWRGSPANATCYPDIYSSLPVTAHQLGKYLPEIYGDTMDNFNTGIIGAVGKNQPWPVSGKR